MSLFQGPLGRVATSGAQKTRVRVEEFLRTWSQDSSPINAGILRSAVRDKLEEEIPELLQASCLDAFHDSQARFPPPRCTPGTREAIFDQISDWMNAADEQILWISGAAGAGKSAIAQTVADICARRSLLAGSFFFLRSSPGRDTPECLIPSIALQLRMNVSHNCHLLEDIIKRDPSIFRKDARAQIENLILPVFATTSPRTFPPLFLIIDGLDECKGETEVLQAMETLAIACEPLSILITSRDAPPTERSFDHFHTNVRHINISAYHHPNMDNGNPITVHGEGGMARPRRKGLPPQPPINLSEEIQTYFRAPLPKSYGGPTASGPVPGRADTVHSSSLQSEQAGIQHRSRTYRGRRLTADLAFSHIATKEVRLLDTLTRYGWEGSYLVQAAFNTERLHRGQGILQEIYIFLDSDLDPAVVQQLAAILDPFPVTVYTPEGCHHGAPSLPNNESVWDLWSSHGIYQENIKSQVTAPVDGESSGEGVSKGAFQHTSSNRGSSSGKGGNGGGREGSKKAGDSDSGGDHDGTGGNASGSPDTSIIAGRPSTREIVVPFSSTLTYTDGPHPSNHFTTNACVEIKIEDNHQSKSRPADIAWGGPWFEVKMTQLDADMQVLPAGRPQYHLGFSQIRFIASRSPSPATVLKFNPSIIRSEEDNVKSKSERNNLKGIQAVISTNPNIRLNATCGAIAGEERTQKRWEIVGHYLASDKNDYTKARQTTMIWKYIHNTAFYASEAQNKFEVRPAATFGLRRTSEMAPCLEVEAVMCYSWSSHPRSFKFRDWLADLSKPKNQPPAFFNFLHQTTMDIDLEKVKSEAEWITDLITDGQRTATELGKPDKAVVRRLETSEGATDCEVSLQAALHGRIDLTNEQRKNARPLLESLRRESLNVLEGDGEPASTDPPTPPAPPARNPSPSRARFSGTSSAGDDIMLINDVPIRRSHVLQMLSALY